MASSLAMRRTPLLALPARASSAASATSAARTASYCRLSVTPSICPPSSHAQQLRILQQCAARGRSFSTIGARHSEMSASMKRAMDDRRPAAQPSVTTMQEQNLSEVPTDVGLLPETFVKPTGANAPSLFEEPMLRLKMEYLWAKTRVYDLISRLVYKFTTVKPRPAIGRRGLHQIALSMHKDMYTAFAYGDTNHLARICANGIFDKFRVAISTRKSNERLYWVRLSHKPPRIVSDRVVKLPVPGIDSKKNPCCVRQVIFRIKSKQALLQGSVKKHRGKRETVVDAHGKELPTGKDGEVTLERMQQGAKDVDEYFVLQKRMWLGREERWLVWGLTEESSIDMVE